MKLEMLETIIESLLSKYTGGHKYFSAVDKSIQHKIIVDKLLSFFSRKI